MKLLQMKCPNCGSRLTVDKSSGECVCDSCGGKFLLDDESTTQHVEFDNAEDAGYEFERGRQKAQAEARQASLQAAQRTANARNKKDNTIWWVLGWLFFFPIPLTILVCRSKSLSQKSKNIIVCIIWGFIAVYMLLSGFSKHNDPRPTGAITELQFSSATPDEIELNVGDSYRRGWLKPSFDSYRHNFSSDEVVFVSEDPDVASISLDEVALNDYLYYRIEAVSEGDTYIYAVTSDGSVSSPRIHIIVSGG